MNKHTRKKYPNAVREVTLYEDPPQSKGNVVSLFNETVQRATKAEADLADANKRIASLEKALAASRKVNELAIKAGFARNFVEPTKQAEGIHRRDLNTLSAEQTEQLFASLAAPDDYVDDAPIERPRTPWRESRILRPLCALFVRRPDNALSK